MKKQLLLLLLVSLFMTSSSFAYTILGTRSCGDLLSSDRDNDQLTELTVGIWMKGYITARNYELSRGVDNIDSDSLYYAVIKFCRDNPLKDNDDAAIHIYSNLKFK